MIRQGWNRIARTILIGCLAVLLIGAYFGFTSVSSVSAGEPVVVFVDEFEDEVDPISWTGLGRY